MARLGLTDVVRTWYTTRIKKSSVDTLSARRRNRRVRDEIYREEFAYLWQVIAWINDIQILLHSVWDILYGVWVLYSLLYCTEYTLLYSIFYYTGISIIVHNYARLYHVSAQFPVTSPTNQKQSPGIGVRHRQLWLARESGEPPEKKDPRFTEQPRRGWPQPIRARRGRMWKVHKLCSGIRRCIIEVL